MLWGPPLAFQTDEVLSYSWMAQTRDPDAKAPKTPVHTPALPESPLEGIALKRPDLVTAFCVLNVEGIYRVPPQATAIRIGGSSRCEIYLPQRGLSAVHAELRRQGGELQLIDHSSNGIVYREQYVHQVTLFPGDQFRLRPIDFLALNERMVEYRPAFRRIYGNGGGRSSDEVLSAARRESRNLFIQHAPGLDQLELARAIHAVSIRGDLPHVEVTAAQVTDDRVVQRRILDAASRSTLILTIDARPLPLDPTWVSMLLSRDFHIRTILLAPSEKAAEEALNRGALAEMQRTWIWPLAFRQDELEALFDYELAALYQRAHRDDPSRPERPTWSFGALSEQNRASLLAHPWRENFVELREVTTALNAVLTTSGQRTAAAEFGKSRSVLRKLLKKVGVAEPWFRPKL